MTGRVAVFRMLKSLQLDHVERAFAAKFGLSQHTHIKQKAKEYGYRRSQFKESAFPRR
jgi:hypothetical protein